MKKDGFKTHGKIHLWFFFSDLGLYKYFQKVFMKEENNYVKHNLSIESYMYMYTYPMHKKR